MQPRSQGFSQPPQGAFRSGVLLSRELSIKNIVLEKKDAFYHRKVLKRGCFLCNQVTIFSVLWFNENVDNRSSRMCFNPTVIADLNNESY